MSKMLDFLGGGAGDSIERRSLTAFETEASGLTKQQRRALEMEMLQPEAIPEYCGQQPPVEARDPAKRVTVRLVFPDVEQMDRFRKWCAISKYIEPSCADISIILAFMEALENGILLWNKKTKQLTVSAQAHGAE